MKKSTGIAKWSLAAALLLMPSLPSSSLEAYPEQQLAQGLSPAHCEEYPHLVICKYPGIHGRFRCYNTLCEAVADGAFGCKVPSGDPDACIAAQSRSSGGLSGATNIP